MQGPTASFETSLILFIQHKVEVTLADACSYMGTEFAAHKLGEAQKLWSLALVFEQQTWGLEQKKIFSTHGQSTLPICLSIHVGAKFPVPSFTLQHICITAQAGLTQHLGAYG
jgi:hypothetical protein